MDSNKQNDETLQERLLENPYDPVCPSCNVGKVLAEESFMINVGRCDNCGQIHAEELFELT